MNYIKEAKSLTFTRGSEVSQVFFFHLNHHHFYSCRFWMITVWLVVIMIITSASIIVLCVLFLFITIRILGFEVIYYYDDVRV